MNRRGFLKLAAASVAGFAAGIRASAAFGDAPGAKPFDRDGAARALAEHRIAKIESRHVQDRFPRAVGPNAKTNPVGHGGAYQVCMATTDQGASGWAMCAAKEDVTRKFLGERLADLFDPQTGTIERVPQEMDRMLYDLVGNILGKPVYELLGGAGPREVALYTGAIYLDDVMPLDKPRGVPAVLDACQQDYDAGYRAFKLKIGRGFRYMPKAEGLKRDIAVTRAVRERFADCRVLVDANDCFTVEDAISYVKAVADCDLYWIEEPFEEDRDSLKRLRDAMAACACKALIADGEARKDRTATPTAYGGYTQAFVDRLYALAAEKLVDVFVLDLGIVGFNRWRKIMPELVKAGVQASPHTWMWTPRPVYAAQLAAGVGNIAIVEGIPGKAAAIDYSAYRMKDGRLVMPKAPGFGLGLRR